MMWWAWIVFGVVLMLAELSTPGGFYLFFLGVSGLLVGFLDLLGIAGPPWVQWMLFSVFSVVSIAFLRKPLVVKFSATNLGPDSPSVDTDSLIGEIAIAAEPISAGAIGRVELRGAAWKAQNRGSQSISQGQRCVVEGLEGLQLLIHAE
jgi:membrane protein implicated in regulation of membrane protease activity